MRRDAPQLARGALLLHNSRMSTRLLPLLLCCALSCHESAACQAPREVSALAADGGASSRTPAAGSGSPDAGRGLVPQPTATHCERDDRFYTIGEWFVDDARCEGCVCQHGGTLDCHQGLCGDVDDCDGGMCGGCSIGAYEFRPGESFACGDGCNHCTCTASGAFLMTGVVCDDKPELAPCSAPPESDTTRIVFLENEAGWEALSLQAKFPRGGCEMTAMRGCYALEPRRVRVWVEPESALAACDVPFFGNGVFGLRGLLEELARVGGSARSIELASSANTTTLQF